MIDRFIAIFFDNRIAKWSLIVLLCFLFVLGHFGYLDPIIEYLDSEKLSAKVGNFEISAYKLLKGIIVLVVLLWVTGIVSDYGQKSIKAIQKIRPGNRYIIAKSYQIMIYFISFFIALNLMGIDPTALAIFGGAAGIGIGFGLQKVTSNFISGLILLFEKSIEVDDLIELNDGTFGFIRSLNARYMLVETFDGKEIMIPNEDFITNRVTNWTYSNTKGRIAINIPVSYKSDLDNVKKLLLETALEHPRCSKTPEPECFLREFKDSSAFFTLFFWVDDVILGRFGPQSDVMLSIWKKFKKNGIEIPFPQTDIHMKEPVTVIHKNQ